MKSLEKQITSRSCSSSSSPNNNIPREDVWNGIATATPHSLPTVTSATAATTRSVFYDLNLHDLLHTPPDPPPPPSIINKTPLHQQINASSQSNRYKRMVKNRESAARSRARKQAYTYELELEVAHLQKENAKLRRLLENKVKTKETAPITTKKQCLHRTLTAPF